MAVNPMQKKSRISFILGMLAMFVIATIVVVFLIMKIQDQKEEIEKYNLSTTNVYVLKSDVKSGQVLTSDMFELSSVPKVTVPANSTSNVGVLLSSYYSTEDGIEIGAMYEYKTNSTGAVEKDEKGQSILELHYYVLVNGEKKVLYREVQNEQNKTSDEVITDLTLGENVFYYEGEGNTKQKHSLTVADSNDAVIAKVDMKANTIITSSLITRSDEKLSDDLRQMEYNVLSLPIDLITGEYVDIRLQLANGQDYIVLSKKQVKVPVVNGAYVSDTIQMNLTEKELLYMSCAIVENFQMTGSKLYAVKYTEAGLQEKAELTYVPNQDVINLIRSDKNIVNNAIEGIVERRNDIENELREYLYEDDDSVETGIEKSKASTLESRKAYLETLVPME